MSSYEEVKQEVSQALLNNNFFTSQESMLVSIGKLTYSLFPVIRNGNFSGNYCVTTYHPKKRFFNKNPNILLDMWIIGEVAVSQGFYVLKHVDRETGEIMLYLNKRKEVGHG